MPDKRQQHISESSGDEADGGTGINGDVSLRPLNHEVNGNATSVKFEPQPERAAWDNKLQFFLSVIGYSVGLGNIWRFPYLCQQNGGGAFLIPFFIMLILEGVPLFLIELGMGQRLRQGSLGTWNRVHPWLGGIGIAATIVAFVVGLYYNVIIAWCFYYLFNSFRSPLPWADCPIDNGTVVAECDKSSSTAYFWFRKALDISPNIDQPEGLKWWMVLCLLLSWILVYFIIMRGIQSSGKIVYFTAIFPYLVLTIFFIRGITLKGSGVGLLHMYTPKLEKLLDPTVWLDAAVQVFYSFGLAFGSLIAFGSYNPPKNNCVKDVIIISICNAFTAIYASVVIFAVLGFKAMTSFDRCIDHNKLLLTHNFPQTFLNGTITEDQYSAVISELPMSNGTYEGMKLLSCNLEDKLNQAAEGTGLAFIVFTQAIVELPGAPFWSVLFFMMLLALGIGSQIGVMEGVVSTVFDTPMFARVRKEVLTGVICLVCFLVGLIFVSGAGEYWLKLFDSLAATLGLVLIALLEMVAVMYVYGHKRFSKDIHEMTGYYPGPFWQITWRFVGPTMMTGILVASIIYRIYNKPVYSAYNVELAAGVETEYPASVMTIAALIIVAGVIPIPLVCLLRRFQCLKYDVSIHQGSIKRIETTTSTKAMMNDYDLADYDDSPANEDDGSDTGDDLGGPLNMSTNRNFRMEVLDC